jgi:hypothetical protein
MTQLSDIEIVELVLAGACSGLLKDWPQLINLLKFYRVAFDLDTNHTSDFYQFCKGFKAGYYS